MDYTGICTHKCVYICVCLCEFASSWERSPRMTSYTRSHAHTHTRFFEAVSRQHNTNQFKFRCLNFSLDKRIHNSIQPHILRLVYHRIYTDAFYLSLSRSRFLSSYIQHTRTSMIYVVFNFAKSMRQHHTLYVRFFFSVGSPISVFGLVRKETCR